MLFWKASPMIYPTTTESMNGKLKSSEFGEISMYFRNFERFFFVSLKLTHEKAVSRSTHSKLLSVSSQQKLYPIFKYFWFEKTIRSLKFFFKIFSKINIWNSFCWNSIHSFLLNLSMNHLVLFRFLIRSRKRFFPFRLKQ